MPNTPHNDDPEDADSNDGEQPGEKHDHRSVGRNILAVLIVVGGIVAGGFVGFGISFGSCFKSECSGFEEGAMFYLALGSLLFTVPVAYAMTKRRH